MPLPPSQNTVRRLLRDEAYSILYDAIIDGTLAPGDTLHDDELIRWLGMSRTPIRQALSRLADVGLVVITSGKSPRVAEFDAAVVNQATYATGILHAYSARVTIPTFSEANHAQLEAHLARAREAARVRDLTVVGPAIRDFFHVFHRATGNTVLYDSVEQLTPLLLRFLTPRESLGSLDEILNTLGKISRAAKEHDTAAALALIGDLYDETRTYYLTHYRPRHLAN